MNCLSDCGNAVLEFFVGAGDAACCPWQCAETLVPQYELYDVIAEYETLLKLGLLKNCGTTTAAAKISPSCMGGIRDGAIGGAANGQIQILKQELLAYKKAHELAVAQAAAQLATKVAPGGMVKPAQTKPPG